MNEQELRNQIAKEIEQAFKKYCCGYEDHAYYCPIPFIEQAAAMARGQK